MPNTVKFENIKLKIEQGFFKFGLILSDHPLKVLLLIIGAISILGTQLQYLRTDSSIEGFLKKNDQKIITYELFKDTFGRDQAFIISLEAEEIFSQSFSDKLHRFHNELETKVPFVKTVDSLANARYTYGEQDTLFIKDLLPELLPESAEDILKLKQYALNSPTYKNFLISEDGHLTTVIVKLNPYDFEEDKDGNPIKKNLEDTQLKEAFLVIQKIIEEYTGVISDEIYVAGTLPFTILLAEIVTHDFVVFSILAILVIGSLLGLIFKRVSGVFMPIFITVLGIICTVSAMALLDVRIQMSTSILPSFLLAVCVGDSVHLLSIFYKEFDEGKEKREAISYALSHTGLAIFFTSITTAAGLASFSTSSLSPVAALGTFGAIGSIIAFVLTVTILPCLIGLLPIKQKSSKETISTNLHRLLTLCVYLSVKYPKTIIGISGVILISSVYFASHLSFSHYPLDWLPQNHPTVKALKKHEERMSGNSVFEALIDTGEERGIVNPEFLKKLDHAMNEISSWDTETFSISKAISITDIIKETNRALHDNKEEEYKIPDDKELIAQELFLVELDKQEDLLSFVDERYKLARITIILPWVDSIHYTPLLGKLQEYLNNELGNYTESISITGISAILGGTFAAMIYSTAESYLIAGILITLMMIILVGDIKLGLLSMIPALTPIFIVMALLQVIGEPLDLFTMIIGSIAIGLTVDDNVHFIHGFKREYLRTGSPEKAIRETLLSTGRAMLVTTVVLGSGFLVYSQADLTNLIGFGVLTALCISLALVATFLLAPSLMMVTYKSRPSING